MRNKGIIRTFAIAMALVCLYQLLFTWKTYTAEKEAEKYATIIDGENTTVDYDKKNRYLDSISNEPIFNFLGLRKYTYKECKGREINLGLDLKGGMNVILEVSVADVVKALSNYSIDPTFNQALADALKMQQNSTDDFLTLFERAFRAIDPNAQLAAIFRTPELSDKIKFDASNSDVINVLRKESKSAIDNAFNIIRSRIDKFGVVQPNIQQLETAGRILVELPGVHEHERVKKLLQGSANLEFWETYENQEVFNYLLQANALIKEIADAKKATESVISATTESDSTGQAVVTQEPESQDGLLGRLSQPDDSLKSATDTLQNDALNDPLFSVLKPHQYQGQLLEGSVVGMSAERDTAKVNSYLALARSRKIFPENLRFIWAVKSWKDPKTKKETNLFELHAIKETGRDGRPPLGGDVITDARADFRQQGGSAAEVSMTMNHEGAQTWARMTKENKGRCIAIVLDNSVYSAPRVNDEIPGGRSQITGDFSINEATDLSNILKSGKLPAKATIIQSEVVGPTLGTESIKAGLISFAMALIVVMLYLAFYYSNAGLIADTALLVNMFFLMGVLASLGAVLTLPGIAGIVLTLGMADDANIIIFERIREELRAGKGARLAVADGYKNAYSAIIDGNVTSFLVGLVLYVFGTGPIQGFATTLVLGILTSLFTSIFISRLILERMLDANKTIKFSIPATANIFKNAKWDFIGFRRKGYAISLTIIGIGLISIIVQGFNMGIDFTGGRSYTVRFDDAVNTQDLQASLRTAFENNAPEVKTFGSNNQVKITTDYLMKEEQDPEFTANVDSIVEARLYEGAKPLLKDGTTSEQFRTENLMGAQKVGASIADDIKVNAVIAVILSLIVMFFYIFVQFRDWQFGLGSVISLLHDAIIMLGLYSLLYKIMPFSLEIDQHFIAAILTVIGYSINDTVIIFDRIREYVALYPKRDIKDVYNQAINSTLGRTMNTSLSTVFVLLIIFIFGGEMIRGFAFAIMVGIFVGTYSSVFNAAPLVYEFLKKKKEKKEIAK
ncbi:MAG: protein translocase subunit SecDF [Bacteroidales bacterium]|jgi:SecD/SecF fusion protein|nr:protein translocase subunit SecDF [Bacteroidales bacterium]